MRTLGRHGYLLAAAASLAAACGHPAGVSPAGAFAPSTAAVFAEAARATAPSSRQIVRLTWHSDDGHIQLSGSGAARIAPPDSLRADISAALGLGRAIIIIAGDQVTAQPPAIVDQVLPDRFALWAILGIMYVPPDVATVERAEQGVRTLWKATDAAGVVTTFELTGGALTSVTREQNGRTTSQLQLTRGADGMVTRSSLTDIGHSLRFVVDITGRESSDAFPADVWQLHP